MNAASEIIHQHSRSFSLAARFLPRRVRWDVIALYAWCRTVDDVVDVAGGAGQEAIDRLAILKSDVLALVAGQPTCDPASKWIEPLICSGRINPRHAIELIEGMEMDCQGFRPGSMADLERYCYHVAGTVGLMMAQLMGTRDPAAHKPAVALGIAMQLTNIARDVREDALRGRSYLPDILSPLSSDASCVQNSVAKLLQLAEEQYAIATTGIRYLPRDCRSAVGIALRVYREIGREVVRQGIPVLDRRVAISRLRLLRVAAVGVLRPSRFPIHSSEVLQKGRLVMSQLNESKPSRIAQARSAVCLGLSLTSVMASVLFMLVFINPKEDSYGTLPLVYAGLSLVAAVVLYHLSVRYELAGSKADST